VINIEIDVREVRCECVDWIEWEELWLRQKDLNINVSRDEM
jgi:hypothetical protein